MVRIQICIKQSDPDPYQIEKQDRYRSEKQDPDPYQKGLDPQHWLQGALVLRTVNSLDGATRITDVKLDLKLRHLSNQNIAVRNPS
jgi:hypothetical protein